MKTRLLNLLPVRADVMNDAVFKYICRFLDPETEVVTQQIDEGPLSIECEFDEALAAPAVIRLCRRAEEEGFDAIFVNCFGDPGVRAARECVNIPVFGGFEPAVLFALGLADKIGIVTVMSEIVPLIEGNVARERLDGRVVSVRSVDIPVVELGDHEKLVKALVAQCAASVKEDGAQGIVMGCTGFVDVAEQVREALAAEGFEVPVLEAAQSALKLCETYAVMNLRQSRLTYHRPTKI